ncbi:MAG TPA: glycerol-3-phosphate dehydrogenase [Xanthobacteraceae bacterium]
MEGPFDLAVIGGGINGCGIARDAAGRGLSVFLCDRGDLAGATSSASTKLIHGGLRYLEYYQFRLVYEALLEREVLLRAAPHIIRPLRFVLPHHRGLRPAWLIRLGLFVYDHLRGREILPPTRSIDLATDPAGEPLRAEYRRAFEYSDCWVEDSRLVVLNAVDAAEHGAIISTRTELASARRDGTLWHLDLMDNARRRSRRVAARALVNAAGPWVADVARRVGHAPHAPMRLVKGSHIVVPRSFAHDRAYIFQNADGRVVFAIPYEHDFTLIGTTEVDFVGDPATAAISSEETDYLCAAASEYFLEPLRPSQVVASFAGVRPLFDDGATDAKALSRDYVLRLDAPAGGAPLVTVYGGKITTYRRLAERVLKMLAGEFPAAGSSWTSSATLPGGDFPVDGVEAEIAKLMRLCPSCGRERARRLVRAYGSRAGRIVDGIRNVNDWGRDFGADLSEREVRYLMDHEWAQTAEDVLWRRSRLGLVATAAEAVALDEWMRAQPRAAKASAA